MKHFLLLVLLIFASQQVFLQEYLKLEDGCYSLTEEGKEHYQKTLNSSFDFSGSEYFPPVYGQTHWVCNQVAASYYMMTYETNLKKDLSSQIEENVFSVYFPWNIGNGGYGWFGDHYLLTMEMMKNFGVPMISDNSGDILRDSSIWPSGYDKYYNMMHNRISDYFVIKTNSDDGILTLKSWVYDHCDGSDYGGTATFLTNINLGGDTFIADGLHEGEYLIHTCGNSALHARTIVGFDDNVCYDYNDDGQYTQDIDLNGDGIINIQDSEKGAFKLAESFGPTWQGEGFCWIMYKAMADPYKSGGILNNNVHVIKPLMDYTPAITARLKIKHTGRELFKVEIGISSDINAETYEYIQDFPILNYQGGVLYMQGGSTEADKTIEVGLDLTPFQEYITGDNCVKFFLVIKECDTQDAHDGLIVDFTIIDYTGNEPVEYSALPNVVMQNNDKTVLTVNSCINNISAPKILTSTLPVFEANSNLWYPLSFEGGVEPFVWEILPYFEQSSFSKSFNVFEGTKLTPDANFDGELELEIPFSFPFNGYASNKIKIHTNGYILPSITTNTWTQLHDRMLPFLKNERVIAPLARFNLTSDYLRNDGIWYKFETDTVKIRWKVREMFLEPWTSVEFGCNLMSDGSIDFIYGEEFITDKFENIGGVFYGYKTHNQIAWIDDIPAANTGISIKPYKIPDGLFINSAGVLYGQVGDYSNYPFKVRLTDAKGVSHVVLYELNTHINQVSKEEDNFVELFPNPTSDNVLLKFNIPVNCDVKIEILDCMGKLVDTKLVKNEEDYNIDISNYPKGNYVMKITVEDQISTAKFIKQ
jgi:hypothetical protein